MPRGPKRWWTAVGVRTAVTLAFLIIALFLAVQAPSVSGLLQPSLISSVLAQRFPAPGATKAQPSQEFVAQPRRIVNVHDLSSPSQTLSARIIPFRVPDPELYRQLKQEFQRGKSELLAPTLPSVSPSLAPSVLTSFIGLSDVDEIVPPDTQVAAGLTDLFEMVNLEGSIFTKAGTALSMGSLNSFFGLASSILSFEPKIRFDRNSGRWFAVLISENGTSEATSTSGQWNLAVSTTSDPTAEFVLYVLPSAANSYPDFPAIGISDDKIVLTANAYSCSPDCSSGTYLVSCPINNFTCTDGFLKQSQGKNDQTAKTYLRDRTLAGCGKTRSFPLDRI